MLGRKNRYKVEIRGISYHVTSAKSEDEVKKVASFVEGHIAQLFSRNPHASIVEAAILTALNFADAYIDEVENHKEVTAKVKSRIGVIIETLDAFLHSRGEP